MKRPVLLLALAVGGCGHHGPPAAPADPGPVVVGPESATTARRDTIETGPRLSGSLQPRKMAAIRAEIGGSVKAVSVELGDKVKAGQVLARIDDAALRDAVRSAETAVRTTEGDLAMAKRQVERVEKLAQAGALAERDLEVARTQAAGSEARLEDAKAKFAQAKEMIGHTVVTSPMDGVVSQQAAHAGDVVGPGAPLFTVIDPSSMRLEASVPSEAVALVAVGTPVQFQVRGYPDPFTGKIERVAPAADPQSRQIPLVITLPNPSGQLLAGLFADGRVMATQHEGLVIPAAAVDQAGKSTTVLRVKDGKVDRVPVELGLRDERSERVEITRGLADGDVILLGAARTLAPGTSVRVDVADRTAER